MQQKKHNHTILLSLMKCLLGAYILTGGCLLLLALLLYRFQLSESVVTIAIIIIYIIATFAAGLIVGKKMEKRKFLWGLLTGSLYFVILMVISLLINHSITDVTTHILTTFLLCAGSGMLGGMLS
ncbi:MAG: TIGR04086 family membrane protein [Lachnospiraceae bacterium]